MALAAPSDLESRLGVSFSAQEEGRALALLDLASGLVKREARQEIERVVRDVVTVRGSRGPQILLPERPVVSVASVTLDGTSLNPDSYYLDGDHLVRKGGYFADVVRALDWPAGSWGHSGVELVVTYTHGYDPVPDAIKAVCLEAAVRAYVNPGSVAQEAYGSERTSYPAQGLTLTADERRTIRRALGRRSESLAIR